MINLNYLEENLVAEAQSRLLDDIMHSALLGEAESQEYICEGIASNLNPMIDLIRVASIKEINIDEDLKDAVYEGACNSGMELYELIAEYIGENVTESNYKYKMTVRSEEKLLSVAVALQRQVISQMHAQDIPFYSAAYIDKAYTTNMNIKQRNRIILLAIKIRRQIEDYICKCIEE